MIRRQVSRDVLEDRGFGGGHPFVTRKVRHPNAADAHPARTNRRKSPPLHHSQRPLEYNLHFL